MQPAVHAAGLRFNLVNDSLARGAALRLVPLVAAAARLLGFLAASGAGPGFCLNVKLVDRLLNFAAVAYAGDNRHISAP